MVWLAYGSAWLSVATVSLFAIRISGNPMWALLMVIPALISVRTDKNGKDCDNE